MNLNWVDLSIIILLLLFTFEGYGKSFFIQVLDLFSFVLALILSLRFYNYASSFLQTNFSLAHSLANVLGFFLVWGVVEVFLALIIHMLFHRSYFSIWLDEHFRALSPIPAFLRGIIFISIILVLLATFPIQPKLKIAVQDSKLGSYFISHAYRLETPLKEVFGGITNDTLTFLTVEPKANESIDLGFKTSNFKERSDLETQMIGLVNQERTSRGIKSLTFDPNLKLIAIEHSDDMLRRGYFSHYSPEGKTVADRAAAHNISYQVIGENLAYAPSLELAHSGLMNSPGHRANILSQDYNKIGIGIDDAGAYGLMITQVFSN